MRERGLKTQQQLAEFLGITQPSVNNLLNGGKPSYDLIQHMVVSLGYNPVPMFTGLGPLRLRDADASYKVPTDLLKIAEKLADYPALVHDLVKHVEVAEEYQRTKEELKARLGKAKK